MYWDSNIYDKQHHFVSKFGADVLQWLAPKKNERILDLGCGTGDLTDQISKSGAVVFGIDISAEMIAAAKQKYPLHNFEIADGSTLNFDQEFDAIFSNATFHWIKNQKALISGVYKSLKNKGRLVAEFGGKGNIQSIVKAIRKAAETLGLQHQFDDNLWFFPSVSQYAALLQEVGFEVEQIWLFDRPTPLVGEDGMYKWIEQFAQHAFINLQADKAEKLKKSAVDLLRYNAYKNGQWIANYTRLRVKAVKNNL